MSAASEVAETAAKVAATATTAGASLFSGAPLALLVALGVSLVAGAGGTIWYRMQWVDLKAEVAEAEKIRAQKIIAADERDNKLIRELSVQLAPIISGLNKQNTDVQIALGKVKSDPNCGATDAGRAFDGIVQPAKPGPRRTQ